LLLAFVLLNNTLVIGIWGAELYKKIFYFSNDPQMRYNVTFINFLLAA